MTRREADHQAAANDVTHYFDSRLQEYFSTNPFRTDIYDAVDIAELACSAILGKQLSQIEPERRAALLTICREHALRIAEEITHQHISG